MEREELDRLCELTNIGAGHAASAFAQIARRPIVMGVPHVRAADQKVAGGVGGEGYWGGGVLFEFQGCLGALVGVLFRRPALEALVRAVIGESDASEGHADWAVESALTEVANILVSHVASAIADTLGERLLPGLPMLVGGDCDEELLRAAAGRNGEDFLRIECELSDRACELGGLLVLVPDQQRRGRRPGG